MRNEAAPRNGSPTPRRFTFGQVAIRKGFTTSRCVDEALHIQQQLRIQNDCHKPIGLIMLEMGVLGTTELIEVLREMNHRPSDAIPLPAVSRLR